MAALRSLGVDPPEQVRLGKRTCRYCRQPYTAPVGSKRDGCPTCAPTLLDALAEPAPPPPPDGPFVPPDDGIPF